MAEAPTPSPSPPVDAPLFSFDAHPSRYRHWHLTVDGATARLAMAVDNQHPHREGYDLKLNSYDLAVDIELADAVQRLRFEHPEVKVVVVTSDSDRVFCAGANIFMLASSGHPFKVNFCKFTNETRLAMEDASARSGQRYLAACNGTTAGGGYELALACDEILLIDDGSSAVSLPEVPLLGVLPGTGGLTRVVDKRKVRRDLADMFSTLAEGVKGKRAVEWRLCDATAPRSKFADLVKTRAQALAAGVDVGPKGPGIALDPVVPEIAPTGLTYRHVAVVLDAHQRTAELTIHAPCEPEPATGEALQQRGAAAWAIRAFRELDDALLRLRFHYEPYGLILLKTRGEIARVLAVDEALATHRDHWLVRETILNMARTLRRLELTGRSLFAVIDPGSCFAGSLLEIALAADRIYMLDDDAGKVAIAVSDLNGGALPMPHGLTRLQSRFLGEPARVEAALALRGPIGTQAASKLGLTTVAADEIDFAEELRVAIEERASMSPDALTGMEASLRFAGPESTDTKIFGRLSAWQNWIFIRPNATGPRGALTLYGKPERPGFDWRRT
ncbi:MAG: benzoyl-CoA-dihydrodiol lyase [Myxococcales bacterium]|nr:benzoyl-CoA-dihydrodiol lyase [Myxococcales bacterium]